MDQGGAVKALSIALPIIFMIDQLIGSFLECNSTPCLFGFHYEPFKNTKIFTFKFLIEDEEHDRQVWKKHKIKVSAG